MDTSQDCHPWATVGTPEKLSLINQDLAVWGRLFQDFFFLGPCLQHMEVPRQGVKSELQLLAYATATAMADPSCICDLHCSWQQCWILNPLSRAGRDQTSILMDASWVPYCWATTRTPQDLLFASLDWLLEIVVWLPASLIYRLASWAGYCR